MPAVATGDDETSRILRITQQSHCIMLCNNSIWTKPIWTQVLHYNTTNTHAITKDIIYQDLLLLFCQIEQYLRGQLLRLLRLLIPQLQSKLQ